ncbi:zinc ribbon domain-containing protein, partial [Streptomyces sp. V2]|uniref:zinc ribbon domain-containing protein n=1 Tax=Streptomyces sp. V2 TaxID=1424099 RepID=UPI003204BC07
IQPVLPAKAATPRPTVRPVPAEDEITGPPCPACGTPNPPGRRFCRRCAAPLVATPTAAPLPWWRTVWPFRPRRVRASSGRATRFLVILLALLALCAAVFFFLPAGRALYEDTRDKLGKPQPITPLDIKASTQTPNHPPTNTSDGIRNNFWGATPGATITYTFRSPFRLVDTIITNGAGATPKEYNTQARALEITLVATTSSGDKKTKKLTLNDKPGEQPFHTAISDVKTITLTLNSPTGLTQGRQLALAEVEFFKRA